MLRPVTCDHLNPRLIAAKIDNSDTAALSDIVGMRDDFSSCTGAADSAILQFKDPFRRKFVSVISTAANDSMSFDQYFGNSVTSVYNKTYPTAWDQLAAGVATTFHTLLFGFDHSSEDISVGHNVLCGNLKPRIFGVDVAADGTITSGGNQVSLVKATGTHTFTFKQAFAVAPVVLAIPIGSTCGGARTTSTSASGAVVTTVNAGGTETSTYGFHMIVVGWDLPGITKNRSILMCPQRKARLIVFRTTLAGTADTTDVGSKDITFTRNGVGDYTLTFVKPFKRAPHVVGGQFYPSQGGHITLADYSTTAIQLNTFQRSSAAIETDELSVFILGYDDATEY